MRRRRQAMMGVRRQGLVLATATAEEARGGAISESDHGRGQGQAVVSVAVRLLLRLWRRLPEVLQVGRQLVAVELGRGLGLLVLRHGDLEAGLVQLVQGGPVHDQPGGRQ